MPPIHRLDAVWLPRQRQDLDQIRNRSLNYTYISRSFRLPFRPSRDFGQPARYIQRVFLDHEGPFGDFDWEAHVIRTTPAGRKQLTLMVARENGAVRELIVENVSTSGYPPVVHRILRLDRDDARKLINLLRCLEGIPVEGNEALRIDDDIMRAVLDDPRSVEELYDRDPMRFRHVIENDEDARDLAALAHRKSQVALFRGMLSDPSIFEQQKAEPGEKRERVWQRFLERNPWILGVTLSGLFLTCWDRAKLEQTVVGNVITRRGKRVDALLRTVGQIRSMVFAEIKHDETILVEKEYRGDCWVPSADLSGGVIQIQQTVYSAREILTDRVPDLDDEGNETGEFAYLLRPRSYLIAGNLKQLRGPGGINKPKYQSFELFRRNLYEPEIVTFDELLARAEWHVLAAEKDQAGDSAQVPA